MERVFVLIAVSLPFLGAALILIAGSKRQNLRDLITLFSSLFTFLFVSICATQLEKGKILEFKLFTIAENIDLYLKCDPLGAIFASLSSFLWIFVSIYSIGYMRALSEHNQTRFYFSFAVAIGSAIGVAYSGNLLTMYMFYEILTFSTYPLVSHEETEDALKAGRKYLAYLLTGAGFVLFGIVLTYILKGTTDFVPGGFFSKEAHLKIPIFIFFCFFLGFGTKAAIMPLHEWLPSAMVAPTPVSALLHAVAVVKAGVFSILRTVLYVFGPEFLKTNDLWLFFALFTSATVLGANILAIYEDNLKRRLAFSTVNNLSVIILGALLLTPSGIKGAILHMVYHGFMKITLFMCAGAVYVVTKRELVSQLDGMGKIMPYTMFSFAVCALGLMGIPPVCGFLSKLYLCLGAVEKKGVIFLFVFLLSALLDTIYFAPIIFKSFFRKPSADQSRTHLPFTMLLPILFTAFSSVFLFIFPDFLFHFHRLAHMVQNAVLGG